MESEDRQLSFICPNFSSNYRPSELILPIVFYVEHGKSLPSKVRLHVESSHVWSGTVVDGGKKIEGLEGMMSFYGIRPYSLVLLEYDGGVNFRVQLYSPYATELMYSNYEHCPSSDLVYNKIELAKFSSMFTYNENFYGVYHLVIKNKHLVGEKMLHILSSYACHQLSLDESCKTLKLGFEKHFWNISVDFKNGSLYFGDGWIDFVDESCVMAGDSLSFRKTDVNFKYRVSVFHGSLVSKEVNIGVSVGLRSYARFFKMMTESSLKSGEIEVPHVFICNYGDELSNSLNVNLGGGISTQFKYCPGSYRIYRLHRIFGKYSVLEDYVVFFNYLGSSNFDVSVYDSQWMNHFRDNDGDYRFEDFTGPSCVEDLVVLSDSTDDTSDTSDDSSNQMMKIAKMANFFSFKVVLKASHVEKKSRGVYIAKNLSSIYKHWGKRTSITLGFGAEQWTVEALRNHRVCRFGIGWDDFIKDNNISADDVLYFEYVGHYGFHVRIDG
ncbi:hypothetical protein POM88_016743 [Heracleum sosnowskyi]|uniref:TF-B3 domain-containing protein n=1 Tax=Heracleum sosnowskyi TaxID=360622 RepID=A0AAD8IMT8_9APIA|nr:hypothetical protein POM88_016743 [Heracleum sosnowskyi]